MRFVAARRASHASYRSPSPERAVQHGHAVAEHGAEPIDGLRREGDLGHEHDRRPAAALDHLAQQLDVDQRLAAAGDAVEQQGLARLGGDDGVDGGALCVGGHVVRGREHGAGGERIACDDGRFHGRESARDERLHHRGREAELRGEVRDLGVAAHALEDLEQLALSFGAGEGLLAFLQRGQIASQHQEPLRPSGGPRRGRAGEQRRQRRPHHYA